jgi:membrane protease YdiL (CAAX protease family)
VVSREEAGLTLRQNTGSLAVALGVTLILGAWALVTGILAPKGAFDSQTLVYLALMPGLNEELIYRGLLLAIINRLFRPQWNFFGARIGWGAVVSSVVFGLLRGLWFDDRLTIHMNAIAIRNAALSGFVFAWLRERT